MGGALGVYLANLGLKALLILEPGNMPRSETITIDSPVLLFSLVTSLLVSLAFGLLPALKASRPQLAAVLGASSTRTTSPRQLLRRGLVVVETAVSVTLVVGASLLLQSFWQLRNVDPGFDPAQVLTAGVSLPASDYPEAHDVTNFYQDAATRIAALPGISSVSVSNALYDRIRLVLVKGIWQSSDDEWMGADVMMVSPDYFRTLGIPLIAGRAFTAGDGVEAPRVAIINQALAAALLADRDPLGQHVRIEQARPREPTFETVGLIGNSRTFGLAEDVRPQIYFPLPQIVPQIRGVTRGLTIAAKTEVDPITSAPALRNALWEIDDRLAIADLQTMSSVLSKSIDRERFLTTLLTLFGGLALLLAAVGIYRPLGPCGGVAAPRVRHPTGPRSATPPASRNGVLRSPEVGWARRRPGPRGRFGDHPTPPQPARRRRRRSRMAELRGDSAALDPHRAFGLLAPRSPSRQSRSGHDPARRIGGQPPAALRQRLLLCRMAAALQDGRCLQNGRRAFASGR